MSELYFNYARREINPPFKMGLAGYFNTRIWTKIRDTLEVRVAAFRSGEDLALLIQYDLIACPPPMFTMLKEALRRAGITATLCVTATHCHTAPEVRIGRGGYEEKYLPFAVARTMEAVGEALSGMTPGTLRTGMSSEGRCCFNRRFWMRDGSVWSNPGKLNPDILRPEGEIDPEIPLLEFSSQNRKTLLLAGICNHADTTGGSEVSGDWPGWTRRLTEEWLGTGTMVMPVIGCSGDINHFDVRDPGSQTSPEEAERIGRIYADAVIRGCRTLKTVPCCDIRFRDAKLNVPGREISREEIAEAENVLQLYRDVEFSPDTVGNLTAEDLAKKSPVVLKYFAQCLLDLAAHPKRGEFELSLLDFGPAAVLGVPCEPFAEAGLILRRLLLADKVAMCAILNNGSGTGYIPNAWNYGRGGYETTPRSNPLSVHAMRLLLESASEIIRRNGK